MLLFFSAAATPAVYWALAGQLPNGPLRKTVGPLGLVGFIAGLLTQAGLLSPPLRLFCCSLWLLSFIKGWSLLKVPRAEIRDSSKLGLFLFSYCWPGVDPTAFKKRGPLDPAATRWFAFGFPTTCVGIAALCLLTLHSPTLRPTLVGLGTVFCILTLNHLGFSDVLSSAMRLLGFPVQRLFEHPLACRSLRDFWSNRWNRPFVEMNKRLFQPLLKPYLSKGSLVFVIFLISGLLHELALSFPPGAGYGGPLCYFLIQGVGMQLEAKGFLKNRMMVWTWLLLPMPVLFHWSFLSGLVLPLVEFLRQAPALRDTPEFWRLLLTFAAYGHFLVLAASFQVPHRLNWTEELQRLRPLNRKLLWTYGGYIASMILLWGLITLYLLPEMLAGEKGALVITAVIALFWWSRIVIDAFYFEHSDWPEGPEFVLGHTCLTTLFVTLASTYTAVVVKALLPV